jgi:hypothetical protein
MILESRHVCAILRGRRSARNGELDRMGDVDDFDSGLDGQLSQMAWSSANRARSSRALL